MKNTLNELLRSKKAIVMVIGIIFAGVCIIFGVDPEKILAGISAPVGYILAQGAADSGKEAAKIENPVKFTQPAKVAKPKQTKKA